MARRACDQLILVSGPLIVTDTLIA